MKRTMKMAALILVVLTILFSYGCSNVTKVSSVSDLNGQKMAIATQYLHFADDITENIGEVEFVNMSDFNDTLMAVKNETVASSFALESKFTPIQETHPTLKSFDSGIEVPLCALFSGSSEDIRLKFNEFIAKSKENGYLDELTERSVYSCKTNDRVVDYEVLDGTKGTIRVGISDNNMPMGYVQNESFVGFEAELLYDFCAAYGYKVELFRLERSGVLAGVKTGKYDIGFSGFDLDEERTDNSNYSDSYYTDKVVYVYQNETGSNNSVFSVIKDSLKRNFVTENRWKIILSGLATTADITFVSAIIGTSLAFVLYIFFRNNKAIEKLILKVNSVFEAMPVLVILMIFYYGLFGESVINGEIVSIIVFGMIFTFNVYSIIESSVNHVDHGQYEGAIALGYNENQTLFKVILPQAMKLFLPSYKSSIISLLNGTAIVGYVAVTDLTSAGDIIRNATFDAIVPLLTVALLYFIVAKLIILILDRVINKK